MKSSTKPEVAIVDYGMGNLYSVRLACEHAGLSARITSSPSEVRDARAVILPGVGAFGDAMEALRRAGLVDVLRSEAASGKPVFGICLGLQLLMTESFELGRHPGLGVIPGTVVRFENPRHASGRLKVPQVGWNRAWKARRPGDAGASPPEPWRGTPMENLPDGAYMYFVHSFHVVPENPDVVLSTTRYGDIEFCSSLGRGNLFACQFHPERSGTEGLRVYEGFARQVTSAG